MRAWRLADPVRAAAADAKQDEARRLRNAANPAISKAREAARYAADPAKHRKRVAAYRAANRKRLKVTKREAYAKNPSRYRAYTAKYREKHPERVIASSRKAYALNPEKGRAATRRWQKAHPELHAQHQATRRARRHGNGGSHTLAQWREKCELYLNRCAYCGEARRLTRDHKIPLSSGGTDDISNIVPACQSCNSRKKTKTAFEFAAMMVASNPFAGAFRPA